MISVFVSYVSHAFASFHCCLVVTCWEKVDLLALVGDVYCIFDTFPCDILGQVWYLIVSFRDLCRLSSFDMGYPRIIPMKLCDSTSISLGDVIKSSLLTDRRQRILTMDIRR